MMAERIAALPMYDFAGVRTATDALWTAIAGRLRAAGESDVPSTLARDIPYDATWTDARLLFGQACQYPLSRLAPVPAYLLGIPMYTAPGCDGSRYRSAIVVRKDDPAESLAALRGRRCAYNDPGSNSGYNLLRVALQRAGARGRFFEAVSATGSHDGSVRAVATGRADVAAIDCISFVHLQRELPLLTQQLRVLAWSPSSPGLPYVTAAGTPAPTVERLRAALIGVLADPQLLGVKSALLLSAVEFDVERTLSEVRALAAEAERGGYPEIR